MITIYFLTDTPFTGLTGTYINKSRCGGVLTAITASLGSCSRRYDLELCSECVWVEIPSADGISMLIGNRYFPPDTKPEVITDYFHHLENTLDTNNTRVILLGDFNVPGFNLGRGTLLPKCHYYYKLKGDAIYTSTCLLGLTHYVEAVSTLRLGPHERTKCVRCKARYDVLCRNRNQ
jgi:hypothetical protein